MILNKRFEALDNGLIRKFYCDALGRPVGWHDIERAQLPAYCGRCRHTWHAHFVDERLAECQVLMRPVGTNSMPEPCECLGLVA